MSFAVAPRPQPRPSPIPLQIFAALLGGLLLFLAAAGTISGSYQLLYNGRVFPGISMAGVDLSSMTPTDAAAALSQRLVYPVTGQVVFRDGDRVWVATPAELGMVFDSGTSVQRAYDLGRRNGLLDNLAIQLNSWQGGLDLQPVIIFDERVAHGYLQNIAILINQPMVEANLHLDGTTVVYTPGQNGRLLDVDETLANLRAQLSEFRDGDVELVIVEDRPLVLDASTQAEALRQVLSGPLTLTVPDAQSGDPGPWTLEPSIVAGMLRVDRVSLETGWQYQVTADATAISLLLEQIAAEVDRTPHNARFYFDDNTRELVLVESSQTGRTLDIPATQQAVAQGLSQGQHSIPLSLVQAEPEVSDTDTAQSLGVTELVYSYTSYFRGSSSSRLQNIRTAAAQFYGLLIPPNTTFSMGSVLDNISLENGYAEALIIFNGQSITGVGGGVCQVSTTLFRTALFAGYPIVERHEHAYRVYYYEQTATGLDSSLAGLDATVYFPLVDLQFTNDRPYWLLMETYFNPETYSLTWKFYSTNDGRVTEVQNLGLYNVVPAPDPLFVENEDLEAGTCKQVDWPGDGTDITVSRVVSREGTTLFTDSIRTHYEAWQAVYQYGPGTENPEYLASQGLCH